MKRIAMTLVVALLTVSLQCVAACGVLPCDEPSTNSAPVEDCHHRVPAPSDDHQGKNDDPGCGHQTFISEAAPQVTKVLFYATAVATIPVFQQWQPELLPVAEVVSDWSPPLRIHSVSIAILRL